MHLFKTMLFSSNSIRKNFLVQLVVSSAILIGLFSSILYFYIQRAIYEEKEQELLKYAKGIAHNKSIGSKDDVSDILVNLNIEILHLKKEYKEAYGYKSTVGKKSFLILIYPFNKKEKTYLKLTREITRTKKLLDKVLNYIVLLNGVGFGLVIIYALALSKMLTIPIRTISNKLSNMNEYLIQPIKTKNLPEEFQPLGVTINHLMTRIQNFVKSQKELFIGTAHELKTPLSVIKLKNQVTLIKKRSPEEYIEALQVTNKAIDEMNVMVSNILNIGRQEGALLEKPVKIDVIAFLKQKADDFKLLAENENKQLFMDFKPDGFMTMLQVGLLNQIIQNFLQNALKFTPKGKSVTIKSYQNDSGFHIEVIDEGCGIDESVDLFAPFKRQGNKSGAGLGLFLAKSAADAIGGVIELKNRDDKISGTIASLTLNSKLSCIIPQN